MFKLTLKKKIISAALILVVVLSLSSVIGVIKMSEMGEASDKVNNRSLPAVILLQGMDKQITEIDRLTVRLILEEDETIRTTYQEELTKATASMDKSVNKYQSLASTAEEKELFTNFYGQWAMYLRHLKVVSAAMEENDKVMAYMIVHGNSSIYKAALDDVNKLKVLNEQYATEAANQSSQSYHSGRLLMISLTIICTILGIIGSFLLAQSFTKPILRIAEQIKLVTRGNLQVEPLRVRSKDEVGELASDFNEMCDSLRNLLKEVVDNSLLVASTAEQLTASAEQTSIATEQIAISATQVAEGSQTQLADIAETLNYTVGVSKSVENITNRFVNVANLTIQAQEKANNGKTQMSSTVSQIRDVHTKVTQSAEVVNILGEKSAEIRQITAMISDIAARTNLLSLNASIEAARAGEQGKGFAVVAYEVRNLSAQASEATGKISSLVNEIALRTDEVVISMNEGVQSLNEGMMLVEGVGNVFSEIVGAVEEVSGEVDTAAVEARSVNEGTVSMVESMKKIAEISERAADSTQTVASVVEETTASMQEVSAGANMLAKRAEEMNQTVSVFKI
ncbi:methyl-accepting chemotaxis protein [Paenibacillus polymyxa]|uniref:methyl-accepting chemotaxis protein n=1 Tax=Paenibacillus TaxID=44249 RepID=UPI0003642DC7|nr:MULTISPECIES: methyl-accepting chemotaxis protein [Paenibacillus]AIY11725.1 chemotaxis protein [Paenibacillus polymyxa]AUS26089.1 chemotaxis protein [Paenibacillus polymyxa]KAE8559257.1 methyl-accepting chemotaxis protein [Paenibacillus polymyxa]KAF6656290.1 methyl-accepting chemotaxis protein [Paenibacillus sp. EKM301P]KJK32413.1 chemotaxis protein [Paenibacillus polymyxa]